MVFPKSYLQRGGLLHQPSVSCIWMHSKSKLLSHVVGDLVPCLASSDMTDIGTAMPGGWHPRGTPHGIAQQQRVPGSESAAGWELSAAAVTQWLLPLPLARSTQRHWDGCGVLRPFRCVA